VGTSSSASTGGVPTTRWLKGILGLSTMLTVTLLEKNPAVQAYMPVAVDLHPGLLVLGM
jgi:hypothetical protein